MSKQLHYDEQQLVRRLSTISVTRRVAFAASCAERLRLVFPERTGQGEDAYLRETLSLVWNSLINTITLSEIELAERIERCENLVPGEGDDWTEQTAYAQNAAAAVAYTVRCLKKKDPQEAAWAARQVYEALDFYVINRHGIDTQQSEAENLTLSDRSIQAELKRQERDITDLMVASEDQLPQLIEELRVRSERESAELFG